MSPAVVRAHLLEALEFFGYFVLTGSLGVAMYFLVQYRPHSEAKWYIMASIGAAIVCVLYAARIYYVFRIAVRRRNPNEVALTPTPLLDAGPPPPRQSWSVRIAAERAELDNAAAAAAARPAGLAPFADDEDDADDGDAAMAIDAIKARIAERMKVEDKEQEEARRLVEKFGGRS